MATTELDIANRALSRLGAGRIASLAEDTKNAHACNAALPFVRDEVLRMYPWNCTTIRLALTPYRASTTAITAISKANPAVVTVGSDPGLATGDTVAISDCAGMTELNHREFVVTRLTATTYELQGENSTSYGTYTGSGLIGEVTVPEFEWGREYPLPCNVLRVWECFEVDEWTVEQATAGAGVRSIFTDATAPLFIRAADSETDESYYDSQLFSVMAARLAVEIGPELIDPSSTKFAQAVQWLEKLMAEAALSDSQEQTPSDFEEDSWITARS